MRISVSRREALRLLAAGGSALAAGPALAKSPQCQSVGPGPKALPDLKATPLGQLARDKGIALGVQVSVAVNPTDYGAAVYDPAYLALIEREKPEFVAFGGAFNFGNACADPPDAADELHFTNQTYHIEDTLYLPRDLFPVLRRQKIRARADALVWDDAQVNQPWLRQIAEGSSPHRSENRDLDWNLSRMEDFIVAIVQRMQKLAEGDPGQFQAINVVNEPLDVFRHAPRVSYRGGHFAPPGVLVDDLPGPIGYLVTAFRTVVAANASLSRLSGTPPLKTKLVLNEAGLESDQFGPMLRPAMLTLLKKIKAEGVPVDALGIEAHLQPQMMTDPGRPDWSGLVGFLDEVAALGFDIHVTELDVLDYYGSCAGKAGSIAENDRLVALYYETFLTRVLANRAVKAVTMWDLSDRYSFYRAFDVATWFGYDRAAATQAARQWPVCPTLPAKASAIACPRPSVYDDRYRPKPARAAIARAFEAAPARG